MIRTCIVSLICWLLSINVGAQDFASRFLYECQGDTSLVCTSISPKMMEEILKTDIQDKDEEEIKKIISKVHSMRMLKASANGKRYFEKAESMLEKNVNRFTPYLAYNEKGDSLRIMIRERLGKIIELVMLQHKKDSFIVINFTGNMNQTFINRLTLSMTGKQADVNEKQR